MATVSDESSTKKLKSGFQDGLAKSLMISSSEVDADLKNNTLEPSKVDGSGSLVSDDDNVDNSEDVDDDGNSDFSCYDGMLSDDDDEVYDNETAKLQAQFDAADLPTGVEASIPFLKQLIQTPNIDSPTSSSASDLLSPPFGSTFTYNPMEKLNGASIELLEEDKLPQNSFSSQPGSSVDMEKTAEEVLDMYRAFKQFDVVQDYSDHHYTDGHCKSKQPSQNWTKAIQQEWRSLEKDLPDTIFVRVFEERMDLLRAVIVGAEGTPYHNGLFFFDIFFPPEYPGTPPQVYYYSGGLRLNPNLYNCGKVCLSLLNTWPGQKEEKWNSGKSTILQVLLSIQGLVLNEKPFYNEPGYESIAGTADGENQSRNYSEDSFILSCKTMMYTMRRPPKHYEYFVRGHFLENAHIFLTACKAYTEGAQVRFLQDHKGSSKLKREVKQILPRLVQIFTRNGAKDCEQFLPT